MWTDSLYISDSLLSIEWSVFPESIDCLWVDYEQTKHFNDDVNIKISTKSTDAKMEFEEIHHIMEWTEKKARNDRHNRQNIIWTNTDNDVETRESNK